MAAIERPTHRSSLCAGMTKEIIFDVVLYDITLQLRGWQIRFASLPALIQQLVYARHRRELMG